ncbi:phosphoribosylamine--glycine ligase [Flammeovirga yaeyamensis]|uniref:Phosphoribosylamine--glycine ligase n=1 Tax=Flammeovirga yaeyamensis TaxID=367791 RepID=A0AAX1N1I0_9BACT|nr:phosphoribosylamine--glycine ligase [Flammeovirga yaeyamensis]MBB3698448.1 phosphoribosylamine--glycine ligase [Flammeovirga yaeyamensis]NMF34202.1 phosphoribosylamine--glycine ligase [Flammeovirga yaeyamensis]QWG01187.1 phosphoribosylamine--glycine ligase [Flammeovirga yaeyamensis]
MKVLILGSGGREHTLAWKIAQSDKLTKLYAAPGNAGTADIAQNINISVTDFPKLAQFVLNEGIDMLIVGPEAPLVEGVADYFANDDALKHVKVIGPKKAGALLEGSKDYSKKFMVRHNIPAGASKTFTLETIESGYVFLEMQKPPFVLKADGLAAGKGVLIIDSLEEAKKSLKEMLSGQFGEASKSVLVEQFLDGIELSVFVITDGKNYITLPEAKDYKRIGEGDTGLNTGGMGAISPVPFADDAFMKEIDETIVKPTIDGLAKDGIDYVGFIFFGLIKVDGKPFVIEYNARMGDPETEVVIPRVKSDLLEILDLAGQGRLDEASIEFEDGFATTVMCVSGGYPEAYQNGKEITDLDKLEDVTAFHAGTTFSELGEVVTNGGRVIALTGKGPDMKSALAKSFKAAETVQFDKKYFRSDIGFDL